MSWNYLRRHLGHWRGSFTRFSPTGIVEGDTPSLVSLEDLEAGAQVRQVVQYFDPTTQALASEQVLQYGSLSRSCLIFPDGAFSQGSMQLSPVAEFGAELGFVQGDRRLRLVTLFQPGGELTQITLIREYREGNPSPDRPTLDLAALVGTWEGEAVTYFADLRSPESYATQLDLRYSGAELQQTLRVAEFKLTSAGTLQGNRVIFNHPHHAMQVLFLPDGASCNCPLRVQVGHPALLELGWLITPTVRQRLIRRYDARGAWQSLTLVTEHKIL